jgi:hypothetical protein
MAVLPDKEIVFPFTIASVDANIQKPWLLSTAVYLMLVTAMTLSDKKRDAAVCKSLLGFRYARLGSVNNAESVKPIIVSFV